MSENELEHRAAVELRLRQCLARMRLAPLDFRLRVEAGEILVELGDQQRGVRVLRSCADYFTLAGFPVRALWALKLLASVRASQAVVDRGFNLLARHYARTGSQEWGDPIFEMPLPRVDTVDLDDLPEDFEEVVVEVDRRATDIIRGANFPDRLPRFPLLSELSAAPFLVVARAIELRRVPPETVLVQESEAGDAVHLVVAGQVRVFKQRSDGSEMTLATLTEGDMFGEMSLVTESPRVASVISATEVDVFVLERSVVTELGAEASALQSALARQVCDRMIRNLMRLSPLFSALPRDQRGRLMSRFQSRLAEADEDIITEGQVGLGLYIILDGLVQVTLRKGGRRHVLNWLREGDVFGEISLVRKTPATATCTATRRSMLMFLAADEFDAAMRDHPEVIRRMHDLGEFRLLENIYTLA